MSALDTFTVGVGVSACVGALVPASVVFGDVVLSFKRRLKDDVERRRVPRLFAEFVYHQLRGSINYRTLGKYTALFAIGGAGVYALAFLLAVGGAEVFLE